ncbi:unnamed protein product, partial [Brenthis ino]
MLCSHGTSCVAVSDGPESESHVNTPSGFFAGVRTVPLISVKAMDVNSFAIVYWYYPVSAFTTVMRQLKNDPLQFLTTIPTFDNLLQKLKIAWANRHVFGFKIRQIIESRPACIV